MSPVAEPVVTTTDRRGTGSFSSAVKWSYVMDGGGQVLTTLVTFLLARFLGPEVYGTAALALVYILFVQMLQSQGIVAAIVQRRDLRDEHLDSAFWATVVVSVALTTGSIAIAGWYAAVTDTPELRLVVIGMSLMIPFRGVTLVQEAVVRRALDFRSLALRTNLSVMVGGVVAVIAAVLGAGVWALVLQQVLTAALGAAILWGVSDWRPGRRFSRPALRDLLGFSIPSFIAAFAVFVTNKADAILVGVFFGPVAIGLYRFALRLVETLTNLTVRALQQASLSELARHQDDKERFTERTVAVIRLSGIVALPPLAVLASGADEIIALLGDPLWDGATSVLRVLCIVGAVRAVTLFAGPTLQAMGRPGVLAALSWVNAVSSAGAFVVAGLLLSDVASVDDQVLGIAVSRVGLALVVIMGQTLVVTRRVVGVTLTRFFQATLPAVGVAMLTYVVGLGVDSLLRSTNTAVALVVEAAVSGTVAVAVLWLLSPEIRSGLGALRRGVPGRARSLAGSADLVP